MSGTFTPAPGGATLATQVRAQARMEALLMLRNGEQLLLAVVIPLVVLVGGLYAADRVDLGINGEPIDVLTPGVLALAIMSTAFTSVAIATGFERRYGVIKRLGASPLPRHGLLLGKVAALVLVELLQAAVVCTAAALLGWEPDVSVVGVVATWLLGTAAFGALGLFLAGVLRAEATLALANLVYLLLMVAGGVVVPASQYGPLADLIKLLPSGALGEGMRAALDHGVTDWSSLAVLACWALAASVLTARTFRWE